MKRTRIVLFTLLILLLVSGASAAAQSTPSQKANGPARMNAAAASTRWSGDRIDRASVGSGDDRGRYPSVVSAGGTTYVSYYDATNHDLRLAHYVGSSGNCGSNNSWYCGTLDSTGDVGQYSSLAVDSSSSNLHLGIAYYDATNYSLKYVSYSCFGGVCGANIYTILTSTLAYVGQYASLKFDSTGVAHMAYQVYSATSGVGYAYSVSSGGNCGVGSAAGKWQCDIIETGIGLGQYTSLDLNNSNQPRIAYYDSNNRDLRYEVWLGTATGNCGPGNNWWCGRVDSVGDMGRFASMQVNRTTNNAYIAYYDATLGKLKYAHWAGGSGNCGDQFAGNTVWWCDTIDDMGTGLTQAGISLALDKSAYPHILYQDASDPMAPAVLRIARPNSALGQLIGNCGPSGGIFLTWQCDVLDMGDSYTNEADYASITFNSGGLATVAYYESDTFYTTGYLKVLQELSQLYLPLLTK